MSKALSTEEKVINRWLGAQLIDRPNPANHPDYITVLGGRAPLKSIRELLETIINKSESNCGKADVSGTSKGKTLFASALSSARDEERERK